jgi:hypothetical protein
MHRRLRHRHCFRRCHRWRRRCHQGTHRQLSLHLRNRHRRRRHLLHPWLITCSVLSSALMPHGNRRNLTSVMASVCGRRPRLATRREIHPASMATTSSSIRLLSALAAVPRGARSRSTSRVSRRALASFRAPSIDWIVLGQTTWTCAWWRRTKCCFLARSIRLRRTSTCSYRRRRRILSLRCPCKPAMLVTILLWAVQR